MRSLKRPRRRSRHTNSRAVSQIAHLLFTAVDEQPLRSTFFAPLEFGTTRIGRDVASNDIVVPFASVSRQHAELEVVTSAQLIVVVKHVSVRGRLLRRARSRALMRLPAVTLSDDEQHLHSRSGRKACVRWQSDGGHA